MLREDANREIHTYCLMEAIMVLGATGGGKLLYDVVVGCGQGMSDMLRSPPSPVNENILIKVSSAWSMICYSC